MKDKMKNTREKMKKEFDKLFPCIEAGCNNDGTIPEQDREGDWQPSQCEYCFKIRFPLFEWIEHLLDKEMEAVLDEVDKKVIGKNEPTNTGLRMVDEPNTYQNLLRGNQRKDLSTLKNSKGGKQK